MDVPRIAVLNAAIEGQENSRNFRRELSGSLAEFDVVGGQLPTQYDFDGVVVTGSRTSVYWDEPWIDATREWLAGAIDRDRPVLGICWGHQLLADTLGGTVEHMGAYEIGYREIEHTGEDRLFEGIDRRFTAFTTHQDEVTELPPGAVATAENDYSNHGFRLGRSFGVQFHPEYDVQTARLVALSKDIDEERRERVLAGINEENYARACEAKRVFENFHAVVEEVRAEA